MTGLQGGEGEEENYTINKRDGETIVIFDCEKRWKKAVNGFIGA
jgi:hypothetical protein